VLGQRKVEVLIGECVLELVRQRHSLERAHLVFGKNHELFGLGDVETGDLALEKTLAVVEQVGVPRNGSEGLEHPPLEIGVSPRVVLQKELPYPLLDLRLCEEVRLDRLVETKLSGLLDLLRDGRDELLRTLLLRRRAAASEQVL
jgi:hypothetical protein